MLYTIPKGKHRSGFRFSPKAFKDNLEFTFRLFYQCHFYPVKVDDFDINKIFGISFGYPHDDSIRLGWVPCKGEPTLFELYAYYYNQGERKSMLLGKHRYHLEIQCEMSFIPNGNEIIMWIVDYADNTKQCYNIPFVFPEFKHGYLLYPYFGGNNKAPHDMKIEVSRVHHYNYVKESI